MVAVPSVGRDQAEQHAQRGGLAGPVGAEEADDAALLHGEAHVVDGDQAPEALGQPVELDGGHRGPSFVVCGWLSTDPIDGDGGRASSVVGRAAAVGYVGAVASRRGALRPGAQPESRLAGRCGGRRPGRYVGPVDDVDERASAGDRHWSGRRWPGLAARSRRNDPGCRRRARSCQLGVRGGQRHHSAPGPARPARTGCCSLVGPLALVAGARHPVAVLWVTLLATAAAVHVTGLANLSLIVAFFVAATSGHRRAAWAVDRGRLRLLAVWLGPLAFVWPVSRWPRSTGPCCSAAWLAVLVVAAEVVRLRRERRGRGPGLARQADAQRRASEERLRMARDLHDVIGHNISLINVQAGVGLDLMDTQPEQARAALTAIKTVSKEALDELRTMLAALGRTTSERPPRPRPGLDRLPELCDLTRAAGLPVTDRDQRAGPARSRPRSTSPRYRIVQESLTNVARHAGPATATVRLGYGRRGCRVEVLDDGRGTSGSRRGRGPGTGGRDRGRRGRERDRRHARTSGGRSAAASRPVPAPAAGSGSRPGSPSGPQVIRVLIADDQALVRAGFKALLDARDDIEVVGEAADGAEAVALAKTLQPDVVLMDIRMPGLDGLEATRQITADPAPGRRAHRHPHHVRARRVPLRRPALRGQRVPGQGHRARRPGHCRPGGGRGRLAHLARHDPAPDRRVRRASQSSPARPPSSTCSPTGSAR